MASCIYVPMVQTPYNEVVGMHSTTAIFFKIPVISYPSMPLGIWRVFLIFQMFDACI